MFPSSQSMSALAAPQNKAKAFVAASPVEAKKQIAMYSPEYFGTCVVGGAMACGLTHTLVTPMDLVKVRMQVNKGLYSGMVAGWRTIGAKEGISGLFTGWGPTLVGYSIQGAGKYGLYEYFKYKFAQAIGEENAFKYRTSMYLAASASAEVFADIGLAPFEAVKVRMQATTTPFASGLLSGLSKLTAAEGAGGLYKGLVPLWLRQIPYTMMKFASFETTVELIYKHVMTKPKAEYGKTEQLGVTFASGYIAGVFCAVVSHPADTLVSKLNNAAKIEGESAGAASMRLVREMGFMGMWAGLSTRILMVGTLTALQWLVYDSYKVYVGLPAAGATAPAKKD